MVIWLQTATVFWLEAVTVFWLGGGALSLGLMMLDREKYI